MNTGEASAPEIRLKGEEGLPFGNIGWTLGNDCPYRCSHCYSLSARQKGKGLEQGMVDTVISQLLRIGVKTVNLGGNEPIFTDGVDVKKSLLPYIIQSLSEKGLRVGLTTSGITMVELERLSPAALILLNDVDVSLDSPMQSEHDGNRGAPLYSLALRALEICGEHNVPRTIVITGMTWNFDHDRLGALVALAKRYGASIRVNPMKPIEPEHMALTPDAQVFYDGFSFLMSKCRTTDLGDPVLASACSYRGEGCPCGRTSFRIHSITPDGRIPVSPCVYLHDFKTGDMLVDDIHDILYSQQFDDFRRRAAAPEQIGECASCAHLAACRGGCAARSYLHAKHTTGERSLFAKDPYCLRDMLEKGGTSLSSFPTCRTLDTARVLVHHNYLCTWIGEPL